MSEPPAATESTVGVHLPQSSAPMTGVERDALLAYGYSAEELTESEPRLALGVYRAGYYDALKSDRSTGPGRVEAAMALAYRLADELDELSRLTKTQEPGQVKGLVRAARHLRWRAMQMAVEDGA